MDLRRMQAEAREIATERQEAMRAYHAGFPYPTEMAQAAAWKAVPYSRAQHGNVECEAIKPENGSAVRRRHFRHLWWVNGKRVSHEIAASTLAALHVAP